MMFLEKITPNKMKEFIELIKISLYALFASLSIDVNVVEIIMYLMLIDTISGVIKTWVVKELSFGFKKFYVGILSKFTVLIIPMALALMAKGLGFDFRWVVEASLRLIILSEGISFFTNIISIKDKKIYENKDYLSILLHWVRDKLQFIFDNILKENPPKK